MEDHHHQLHHKIRKRETLITPFESKLSYIKIKIKGSKKLEKDGKGTFSSIFGCYLFILMKKVPLVY
jgi:hypothetical protein